MRPGIQRFSDTASLGRGVASLLLERIARIQSDRGRVSLSLTGGAITNAVCEQLAGLEGASLVQPDTVHLWWNWDLFVATGDPRRHSLQHLSRLAGQFPLNPAHIHPIPSESAGIDPESAAAEYSHELTHANIDVCLVEISADGSIAGLPPHGLSASPSQLAVSVSTSQPPVVTCTERGLGRAREVWVLAQGRDVADACRQAVTGDASLAVSRLADVTSVTWMVDQAACVGLPFHHCAL